MRGSKICQRRWCSDRRFWQVRNWCIFSYQNSSIAKETYYDTWDRDYPSYKSLDLHLLQVEWGCIQGSQRMRTWVVTNPPLGIFSKAWIAYMSTNLLWKWLERNSGVTVVVASQVGLHPNWLSPVTTKTLDILTLLQQVLETFSYIKTNFSPGPVLLRIFVQANTVRMNH